MINNLTKRIIPCLDIKDDKVVKGVNFLNIKEAGDPIDLAQFYNDEGADELVFLDITASHERRKPLAQLVTEIANHIFIPFTVGGGINSVSIIHDLLLRGADKVSINSAAIKTPELITDASNEFGSQCIVAAIDAKITTPTINSTIDSKYRINNSSQWEVYINGGRIPTGIDAVKWAKHITNDLGAGEILLTSMDADGSKQGYDYPLTNAINQVITVPLIASGGAGSVEHIEQILHCSDAALLASLLHFKELTIDEIKTYCDQNNINVRR